MKNRKQIIDDILPTDHYGLHFRLVEIDDAGFIVSLRNHEKLSKYINKTSTEIEEQVNWLREYKIREQRGDDFYVLCLKEDRQTKLGLVRIYNIKADEFEIGSWVFSPEAGANVAILGDLFTFSLAYEKLFLKTCKIAVRKRNKRVLWYTRSFNPTPTAEDESSYYFELYYENFSKQRDKLVKMLKHDRLSNTADK